MGTLTSGNKGIFGDVHTNPGRRHCVRLLEDRTPITLDTHPTIMAGANEAPYRESGYRVLMEVPAQRDNTAEALQAYEVLRRRLRGRPRYSTKRKHTGTAPAIARIGPRGSADHASNAKIDRPLSSTA